MSQSEPKKGSKSGPEKTETASGWVGNKVETLLGFDVLSSGSHSESLRGLGARGTIIWVFVWIATSGLIRVFFGDLIWAAAEAAAVSAPYVIGGAVSFLFLFGWQSGGPWRLRWWTRKGKRRKRSSAKTVSEKKGAAKTSFSSSARSSAKGEAEGSAASKVKDQGGQPRDGQASSGDETSGDETSGDETYEENAEEKDSKERA